MFDIFGQFAQFIKTGNGSVSIDNNVFALHYRLTVVILMVFSIVVGSRKYFGDPIDCTTAAETERIVDNYCWFKSYIIVPKDPEQFDDNYHPVITHNVKTFQELMHPDSKYKPYFLHAYQWIEFILFSQAVLFFIPRYLWRYCWEQGRMKAITHNFELISLKNEDNRELHKTIVQYLRKNKYDHIEYAIKFTVCEVLNFINVLFQFVIIRHTLGLNLNTLAEDFITSESNRNERSSIFMVFPNVARCQVPSPRGGGHADNQELCVLPVNVFTTKIYIFLWFYFLGLSFISGLSLIYRMMTLLFSNFRTLILKRTGRAITEDCISVIKKLGYGDWFVLVLAGKNIDPFAFKTLIKSYNDELIGARPSFSLVGSEKLYNQELSVVNINRDKDHAK